MRAIVAHPGPSFSVADVYDGWIAGLSEHGIQVMPYNLDDRLEVYSASYRVREGAWVKTFPNPEDVTWLSAEGIKAAAYDWWPDVIVVVSAFFMSTELVSRLRSRGHKMVLLATESPYEDDRQLEQAAAYDCVVLNDPTNLDKFRQVSDALYIPHAYSPTRHYPGPPDPDLVCDFAFVGTGFPSRVEFFEQVDWTGLSAWFAGTWRGITPDSPLLAFLAHDVDECCPNDETARLYRSTLTSCNLYRREANRPDLSAGWAMGPREVELAACGTWFARDPRPEGDELLGMFPTFTTPAELGDQVRWAIAHPDERHAATEAARAAVADRTFAHNAKTLLAHLGL